MAINSIRKLVFVSVGCICVLTALFVLYRAPSARLAPFNYFSSQDNSNLKTSPYSEYLVSEKASTSEQSDFAPFILRECTDTTPKHYAPCLLKNQLHNAVFAEELIYPAFVLSPPIFAPSRPNDTATFRRVQESVSDRGQRQENGSVMYKEQHGQIYVFENVTISPSTIFDSWSSLACMSRDTSTRNIVPIEPGVPIEVDSAVLANSPDSAYFQHFLDRVTHILGQISHLQKPTYAVTGMELSTQKIVHDVWELLGYDHDHVLHGQTEKAIGRLLWSCRAPLIHPHSSFTLQRLLNLTDPQQPSRLSGPIPLAERKAVLYMGRSNGRAANGGREVLNEDKVIATISNILQMRNRGEELVIWPKDFGTTREMIDWVHVNAAAVIGPHGGALYNHMWAGQDTLVLEFQPHGFQSMIFYEGANTLNQKYAIMHLPSRDNNNMDVDLDALKEILEAHLGTPVKDTQKVKTWYTWKLDEI